MIVHFTEKKKVDEVLAQRLMEVGGESAYATVWKDKPEVQQCFNCQQFGYWQNVVKIQQFVITVQYLVTFIKIVQTL